MPKIAKVRQTRARDVADELVAKAIEPKRAAALHRALLPWFEREKRDLPWRRARTPYLVWLSGIMLQQTRVDTVIPYFARFVKAFPTVEALARAKEEDVLALWSGLGYYRRARMLHAGARFVASERGGAFPDDAAELREIPGIGPYTAGAVASLAFGRCEALVDGNVARVLSRLFAIEDDVRSGKGLARVWSIARELVPAASPGAWNEALMELGATVCTPGTPRCEACPLAASCQARAEGRAEELPRLKAKTPPRDEDRVAIVATQGESVLLARRKREGRFGGLWEPPNATVADVRALVRALGLSVRGVSPCDSVVHVLSHRKLKIRVFRAHLTRKPEDALRLDYEAHAVVRAADFGRLGLSTLAKKMLRAANVA